MVNEACRLLLLCQANGWNPSVRELKRLLQLAAHKERLVEQEWGINPQRIAFVKHLIATGKLHDR
jgi:hypothetical protein